MNLFKNALIEWIPIYDDTQSLIERILFVESETGLIITIDFSAKNALPMIRKYQEVLQAIENGSAKILDYDPYSFKTALEEDIQLKHKVRRDEAYELIKEV